MFTRYLAHKAERITNFDGMLGDGVRDGHYMIVLFERDGSIRVAANFSRQLLRAKLSSVIDALTKDDASKEKEKRVEISSEMYAWITTVDGRDSLIGAMMQGLHVPLIAASRETMEKVRHLAVEHGAVLGQSVRLVRFQEVETLQSYPAKHSH